MDAVIPTRHDLVRRGQKLEYFTTGYNSLEGLVSILAGIVAGSVSLIGFGLDSLIEVTSGAALLWRLHHDLNASRREQIERTTLRIVGACFVALALYILYESGSTLIGHQEPHRSIPGIIVAAVSVAVMLGSGSCVDPGGGVGDLGSGVNSMNPHGQADIDILVGANSRCEPEATDNRTESRKVLSLYEWSSLSRSLSE